MINKIKNKKFIWGITFLLIFVFLAPRVTEPKAGDEIWHRWLASSESVFVKDMTIDSSNNVYVVGESRDSLFNTSKTEGGGAYVIKYDNNGDEQWHKWIPYKNGNKVLEAVATDTSHNVYVAGWTGDSLFGEAHKGESDAFLVKYDKDGNKLWHKWLASVESDYAMVLTIDSDNNIYLAGDSRDSLFDEPNQDSFYSDAFLVKYDKDGNKLWHKWLASDVSDYAVALITDSSNNVYLGGGSMGSLFGEVDNHSNSTFVVKYDSAGNELWHKWLDSNDSTSAITIDSNDNVYVAGRSFESLFDETIKTRYDSYIIKYDKDGNKLWYIWLDSEDRVEARSLAIDSADNVYLAGHTDGPLFDETHRGVDNTFIVKYSKDGIKKGHKWLTPTNRSLFWWLLEHLFGVSNTAEAESIAINDTDNIYLAGITNGSLFGEKENGLLTAFLVKYK